MANYQNKATSSSQALVVFLLDVSGSMDSPITGNTKKIDAVQAGLRTALRRMVARAHRVINNQQDHATATYSPRYRVAVFAYDEKVYDVLGGVMTIDEIAKIRMPKLTTVSTRGDTAKGFCAVKELLERDVSTWTAEQITHNPAPLVIHMSDGEFSLEQENPEPIVHEIQSLCITDGNVLVENVFFSNRIVVPSPFTGYRPSDDLGSVEANKILAMSSPLPKSYRKYINNSDISHVITSGTLMMYPIDCSEIFCSAMA